MRFNKTWGVLAVLALVTGTPRHMLSGHETDLLPAGNQSSTFVLPIVKRDSLLNGLQISVLEQQGTGSVSVRLRVNSGALMDLADKGGLSDITAAMLPRGGGGLTAKNVSDTVEQLGLTVGISVTWDSTDIVIGGPADSLSSIFDLLGRLVISPSLDQKEFESMKSQRIAALKSEPADNADLVKRKAIEAVFGSHPYGRPMRGTPETIARLGRADLTYYHNRYYLASNAELLISGDATPEQITQLARAKLGSWNKGERVPPTFRPPEAQTTRRITIFDRPDSAAAHSAIAQIGISRRADDYFAATVMAGVLASLNAKLANAATSVNTGVEARLLPGPLLVTVKSPPDELAGTINSLLDVMVLLQRVPPSIEQIELAKSRILAAFAERLRSPQGTLDALLDIELYGLGRDYLINFTDRVNAVTADDVHRAARKYLSPQSVAVTVAGPANKLQEPMKRIGAVAVIK